MTPEINNRKHQRVRRHKPPSSVQVGMNRSNDQRKPHGGR